MVPINQLFKLLADENRLKMFMLLMDDHYCVCDIERFLSLKQANVSKHLMAFKNLGILDGWKKHHWTHYQLSNDVLDAYAGLCDDLRGTSLYKTIHQQRTTFEKNSCQPKEKRV